MNAPTGLSEAASQNRQRGRPLSGPLTADMRQVTLAQFPEITTSRHQRNLLWAVYGLHEIDDGDLDTLPRLVGEHRLAVSVLAQLGRLAWAGAPREVLRGWAREINDTRTLSIKQAESILRDFLREASR